MGSLFTFIYHAKAPPRPAPHPATTNPPAKSILFPGISSPREGDEWSIVASRRACSERDVAEPEPVEPELMSARFGPPRRGRTIGTSRNARAPAFRHEYCTINHRS